MKPNSLLLYAVCAASLGAQPALAAINTESNSPPVSSPSNGSSDVLLDFLAGAGGTVSLGTFSNGLSAAFGSMSVEKARSIPRFLNDLQSFGVTSTVCEAIQCALEDMVVSSAFSESEKRTIATLIFQESGATFDSIQLAQSSHFSGGDNAENRGNEILIGKGPYQG